MFELSERLRQEGDDFRFSCSSQAVSYLRKVRRGGSVLESPHLDVEWKDGSFSSRDFLPHFPLIFNSFLKQVAFESARMGKFDPNIIVSDSRLSAVLAARMKSYPVVTILNQFKVIFPPRFRVYGLGRVYERFAGDVLGLLWSLSDQVLMTDLPPPYTIGEANLKGNDVANIVRFVGFTSSRLHIDDARLSAAKRVLEIDHKPLVFVQISGPEETKQRFVDTVLKSTDGLSKRYNVVVSIGAVNGSPEPRRLANGTWLYEWCPIKDELFSLSDLVVARSGHRTIGQCIDGGKPAVLIPIHNHPEQIGNAERFRELGLGLDIKSEDLNPSILTDFVEQCLEDSKFADRVDSLRTISKKYDGIGKCAEIINSYS
jgi:UDP-N-acetylglucosamine--N-acetylmuramyl-(pentapeptide) pyrophosphoryl-undecaprenol N-acetylglucosamine transferase